MKQKSYSEQKEKFWNIPNTLSLYRLLIFPVILTWIFTGKENLVVIRVGSGVKGQPQGGVEMRIRPDGKPLLADSAENKTVTPIEDTRFFADAAG